MLAVGDGTIEEVMTQPAIREEIAPDPALRAEFDAAYERFRQAYPAIRAAQ